MKKIVLFLSLLIFASPKAYSEIFVDYVPGSINMNEAPQTKPITTLKNNTSQKAPNLPSHLSTSKNTSGANQKYTQRVAVDIPLGTKLEIKSSQYFSDRTGKNVKLKFTLPYNQSAGSVLLPAGTILTGHVEQSHKPQWTSNGGLIKFVIDDIIYQNISNEVETKVLKANSKTVFFNTIKGERKFWKNTVKNANWGYNVCKKSYTVTSNLSKKGGLNWIITPFPAIGGTVLFGANAVLAPVIATFQKGGNISFEAGSKFVIKLQEPAKFYVNGL
ncbi:hypothetical protein J6Q66_00660 [bacterium]|nr:hypothetical protein [bacterium]